MYSVRWALRASARSKQAKAATGALPEAEAAAMQAGWRQPRVLRGGRGTAQLRQEGTVRLQGHCT